MPKLEESLYQTQLSDFLITLSLSSYLIRQGFCLVLSVEEGKTTSTSELLEEREEMGNDEKINMNS